MMDDARPGQVSSDVDFRTFFRDHFSWVWNALRRLGVPERDREDLANEIFFRVHRALGAYDASRPIRPWLFAFVVRVVAEHRRTVRRRAEDLDPDLDVAAPSSEPERRLERAEQRAVLHEALDALDLEKRAVFVLHELEETPIPEVARAFGIPEATAYSRLRAARLELAAAVRRIRARRGSP